MNTELLLTDVAGSVLEFHQMSNGMLTLDQIVDKKLSMMKNSPISDGAGKLYTRTVADSGDVTDNRRAAIMERVSNLLTTTHRDAFNGLLSACIADAQRINVATLRLAIDDTTEVASAVNAEIEVAVANYRARKVAEYVKNNPDYSRHIAAANELNVIKSDIEKAIAKIVPIDVIDYVDGDLLQPQIEERKIVLDTAAREQPTRERTKRAATRTGNSPSISRYYPGTYKLTGESFAGEYTLRLLPYVSDSDHGRAQVIRVSDSVIVSDVAINGDTTVQTATKRALALVRRDHLKMTLNHGCDRTAEWPVNIPRLLGLPETLPSDTWANNCAAIANGTVKL